MRFKQFINEAGKVPLEVINRLQQLDKLIKKAKNEDQLKELQQEKSLLMNKWFNKDYKEPEEVKVEDPKSEEQEEPEEKVYKDYNPPVGTTVDSIRQNLKDQGIRSAHDKYYNNLDFELGSGNSKNSTKRTFSKQKTLDILRNFTQQIDKDEQKIANYTNRIAPGLQPELNKTYKQFKQTLIKIIQNAGK